MRGKRGRRGKGCRKRAGHWDKETDRKKNYLSERPGTRESRQINGRLLAAEKANESLRKMTEDREQYHLKCSQE